MKNKGYIWLLMAAILLLLLVLDISFGKVHISFAELWYSFTDHSLVSGVKRSIVLESRLPQALTAIFAGVGLALSGLMMQTFFRNALAGPSVLGITNGSSLGVALVVLLGTSIAGVSIGKVGVVLAAFTGAMLTLLLIMVVARYLRDSTSLLIFGLMMGFLVGALVSVLQFGAGKEALRTFVFWGMGSFSNVRVSDLGFYLGGVTLGIALLFYVLPHLNVMLLGEESAKGVGVNVKRVRTIMLISTGLMTSVITAYCGPIAFLGLAVPHLVRGLWRSSDHRDIVPACLFAGAVIGLAADFFSRMPWSDWSLPLNTVTSMIGAPVVVYILIKQRKRKTLI